MIIQPEQLAPWLENLWRWAVGVEERPAVCPSKCPQDAEIKRNLADRAGRVLRECANRLTLGAMRYGQLGEKERPGTYDNLAAAERCLSRARNSRDALIDAINFLVIHAAETDAPMDSVDHETDNGVTRL